MAFISDMLRNVFVFIDSIIYGFIGSVYELLMDIAATNIFGNDTITKFAERVYALIAVFMLFKLSFSVLTYIINPETANDKTAGGGKLITNVLITLVLLISVPWAFRQVMVIQNDLLKDNIVGKIILGSSNSLDVGTQIDAGDTIAWETFSAFFYPSRDLCPDGWDSTCETDLDAIGSVAGGNSGVAYGKAYSRLIQSKSVKGVQKSGLVTARKQPEAGETTGEYVFDYASIIATLGGGFIVYILLLFCIQIAIRSVKLGVLQLIAPIPIISYIDPKQSKNGMFSKWLKMCGKTFADLFIRLAAIYFAIFIIMEITKGNGMINSLTGQKASGLVKVLIILGALTFAKDLPKFIEEITGIKLDGGFSLNPFKNNALLGGFAGGLIGAGVGAVGGFAGNIAAGNKMRDAFRGGLKGFASGGMGGIKDKGLKRDTFTRGAKAGVATGTNYANWRAAGSKWGGRMSDRMLSSVGAKTAAEKFDAQIKAYDDIAGLHKSAEDYIVGELAKSSHVSDATLDLASGLDYTKSDGTIGNIAKDSNLNVIKEKMADMSLSAEQRADYGLQYAALKDHLVDKYMAEVEAGRINDGAVTSFISQADAVAKQNDIVIDSVTAASFRGGKKKSKQESSRIKGSSEYQIAKANAAANKQAKASK